MESQAWLWDFPFRSDRLCLDFAATLGSRGRLELERLRTPDDLTRWFAQAGLGDVAGAGAAELAGARRLREAIHGLATGARDPALVRTVNRAAAAAPPVPRLEASGRARGWAPGTDAAQALSAVARDAIDLLSGPLLARVRRCEGRDCTILFLDTSRPGTRRWCSMEVCGNQAKSAALRARRAARR
jgi:predicted RNA-binding Zn ribbon-like protein